MSPLVMTTKEELEAAVKGKVPRVVVRGELAEKINRSLKMKTVSKATIAILGAAIAAVPFTGGLRLAAAAPIAMLTGLEIALIMAVFFIGLALVLLILKGYKRVTFKGKHGGSESEIILERSDSSAQV